MTSTPIAESSEPSTQRRFSLVTLCRTLHIYLSMLGLVLMLFFAVTGFVAHHSDWFGGEAAHDFTGSVPPPLLAANDRLGVVEHLRKAHRITGAVETYSGDETVSISFREPGRSWDVDIEKTDGQVRGKVRSFGVTGVLKDLHRGENAGAVWAWVLDGTAVLLAVACITGLTLWLYLPRRRKLGILALVASTLLVAGIYAIAVPGAGRNVNTPQSPEPNAVEEK